MKTGRAVITSSHRAQRQYLGVLMVEGWSGGEIKSAMTPKAQSRSVGL